MEAIGDLPLAGGAGRDVEVEQQVDRVAALPQPERLGDDDRRLAGRRVEGRPEADLAADLVAGLLVAEDPDRVGLRLRLLVELVEWGLVDQDLPGPLLQVADGLEAALLALGEGDHRQGGRPARRRVDQRQGPVLRLLRLVLGVVDQGLDPVDAGAPLDGLDPEVIPLGLGAGQDQPRGVDQGGPSLRLRLRFRPGSGLLGAAVGPGRAGLGDRRRVVFAVGRLGFLVGQGVLDRLLAGLGGLRHQAEPLEDDVGAEEDDGRQDEEDD